MENLTRAAGLYRDHFMAGFTLRDSAGFDDWQFFQSEALRRDFSEVLEKLVKALSDHGEFDQAIAYAQRWLAMDSLHEPAHRRLMQLYAWSGRRNAALRQYHTCVQILKEELSVPPLDETTQLFSPSREPPAYPGVRKSG
jgi:DNA-binding SARP family transcriptional activator